MDVLTSIIINNMYKSQLVEMETNSIKVYLDKNYASLLRGQTFLQDMSVIKLDSDFCDILKLETTLSCSNKVITERVLDFFYLDLKLSFNMMINFNSLA